MNKNGIWDMFVNRNLSSVCASNQRSIVEDHPGRLRLARDVLVFKRHCRISKTGICQ